MQYRVKTIDFISGYSIKPNSSIVSAFKKANIKNNFFSFSSNYNSKGQILIPV